MTSALWEDYSLLVTKHNEENYNEESYFEYCNHGNAATKNASHQSAHGNYFVSSSSCHGNVSGGHGSFNEGKENNGGKNELPPTHGVRKLSIEETNDIGWEHAHGKYRVATIVDNEITDDSSTSIPHHREIPLHVIEDNKSDGNGLVTKDQSSVPVSSAVNEIGTKEDTQSEVVTKIIRSVWQKIDESIPVYVNKYKERTYDVQTGWKVVRIFISSTFTDFFAEREVIVKKVRDIELLFL